MEPTTNLNKASDTYLALVLQVLYDWNISKKLFVKENLA